MPGLQATAGMRVTAAWLNQNIPGAWTAITPTGSWTQTSGQAPFSARMFNSVTIEVVAGLTAGTLTNGTQIGQIPGGFPLPSETQVAPLIATNPAGTLTYVSGQLNLSSLGRLSIWNVPGAVSGTAATAIAFHAFFATDI